MMDDEKKDIVVTAESPVEGDSVEDWPTVRARMLAAARERADRTIAESRARRQARLEGQLEAYELGQTIREAVEESLRSGDSISVEQALAMLQGFDEPRH